jgi:WhiB family redox-sensing transcriptional regulator
MDTAWMEQANCREVVPDTFFPESGSRGRAALRICAGCLVKKDCLEYALANHIAHGIWGGASERERQRIAAARRREAQRSTSMALSGGPEVAAHQGYPAGDLVAVG